MNVRWSLRLPCMETQYSTTVMCASCRGTLKECCMLCRVSQATNMSMLCIMQTRLKESIYCCSAVTHREPLKGTDTKACFMCLHLHTASLNNHTLYVYLQRQYILCSNTLYHFQDYSGLMRGGGLGKDKGSVDLS